VTSPDEIFWSNVATWKTRQAHILIECRQQPFERRFVGTVGDIFASSITFCDIKTEESVTMDFNGVEFRLQPFEPIEAVIAFGAIWKPDNEPSVFCVFTELRDFGRPS
jgi:hypothetical protein